ncbi:MAG TPA: sigma-70 family RNA polymerase sigma factor [Flavobacteriales bacterium]|nr:sigma-70 family RNA polymerase sigma factor [Flavobacteriales bacterium]
MVTEALIARCAREETKAQYELYRELHRMMMSICSRYERNQQDATARMNQGFLRILQNIDKRRPEVPFELWARRIMINTVIDEFRKDRDRKAHEVLDVAVEPTTGIDVNGYLRHMEAEAFAELLLRVPPMSRHVFNLFAIDGFGHAEIATLLGISEGTSKWHVSNARSILQNAIAQLAVPSTTTAIR